MCYLHEKIILNKLGSYIFIPRPFTKSQNMPEYHQHTLYWRQSVTYQWFFNIDQLTFYAQIP